MTRHATDRLLVAATTSVAGVLLAVLGGLPEAAILVAPWAVLLVLGLANSRPDETTPRVEAPNDRVLVGDEVEVNVSWTGAAGTAFVNCLPSEGFWPPNDEGDTRRGARAHDVLVHGQSTITCWLQATRWGTHDVGRIEFAVTEPYGLFQREGAAGQSTQVRVHPTPTEIQNLLAPWLMRRVTGVHGSKVAGRGIEYADIRQYSAGDSLRDINWRVSARSPGLWVSQRHPDQATDVILLLDSFVESGHDVHAVVGLAIEAAVALAESHLAVTDRVGLVDLGGLVRWVSPGTGQLQLQHLIDTLLSSGLYAHVAERNLDAILARMLPPRSFVVALTPLLDDRFIDALFVLAGHGHDVGVIECDVAGPDDGESEANETLQLARRFWEADRQVVRDRLAAHGVAVAGWRKGRQLDLTLEELTRRRQRTVRARRR